MDVYESEQGPEKQSAAERTRLPLVPAENKNGGQTREVRLRYTSPSPSSPTVSRRCSSPTASRTSSTSAFSAATKRATSAERRRPSRPLSPRAPSTPIQDTAADFFVASRKVAGNKLPPESLWPSTMRSLNVSFQTDTFPVHTSKKEKPASHMPDHTLRQSSNVAHRQAEVLSSRKQTPERKQSPLRGKNSADQSENSKPVDSLHPRVVDQFRWPSTTAGKVCTASNRSIDLADKKNKVTATPSPRRLSLSGFSVSSKSIDPDDKTSKTSPLSSSETYTPSRRRSSLDGTTIPNTRTDQAVKTSKISSLSCLDTGSPSLRGLSLDGTVDPNRSIDLADKKSKTSSVSSWGTDVPTLRRLSLDGNANLNRSTNFPDKKSKISSSSHLETGSPSLRRLSLDGNAVQSRSIDLSDKESRVSPSSHSETVNPSLRRLSLHGNPVPNRSIDLVDRSRKTSSSPRRKPFVRSTSSDFPKPVSSDESGRAFVNGCSVDESSAQMARPDSSSSSDRTQSSNDATRSLPIHTLGLLPVLSTVSRWMSPSRSKAANSSRGSSPTRKRPSSPIKKLQSSTSVLSFITDIRRGKKAANHIEDVHNLRLLYNRLLQWRYVNAQSDDALQSQKVKAAEVLCSVWMKTAALWDSIVEKKVEIQQLRLKMKLYSVLDNQIICLDEWASTERDHDSSLAQAIHDLEASTIRVPFIKGARGDSLTIKAAISSAVDVMQAMGSTLGSTLLEVDRLHRLVSELAYVAIQERALLDEYESIISCIAKLQVEENSLRSHLLQMKQGWSNDNDETY